MATADIDSLQIEIEASSADAASKIDALAKSLSSLKTAAQGGGNGLSRISKQVQALVSATNGATSASDKIASLYRALQSLGSVQKASGLSSTINALRRLGSVDTSGISSEKMRSLSDALNSLGSVQKADGLNSTVNALKKLSDVSKSLADTDLDQFAKEMQRVADAVKPLADEMQKVSNGFSAFPIRIQKLIQSSNGLAASNQKSAKSFSLFGSGATRSLASLTVLGYSFGQLANTMGNWVKQSNDYVENLNLFTVSMGRYAESAKAYAETVQEAVGIDPSEWMRNQGIFMQMASGFGVAEEKAALMSQNLTQLGYDISSLYNIDINEAMQKLQSGLAGEIEPLRRLGITLEEATLQQIAYNNGIEMSVQDMTQAQKSQLRYVAIMQQSENAMGDMARTVQSPANAMRILNQQITQLQRALGNLLMPALQVIIPYVQAFVELLTEGIQALALFFGFELPTIDYSNIDNAASSAGDIATGLDDATKAAKDLKNATLGIDELNIISQDTGAGAGAGGGAGGGFDLPLELPEYDFLAGLDKDIDDLKQQLKDLLLHYVLPIGAGFAAWELSKKFLPELGTLKRLLGSLMVGVGLSLVIDSIDDIIVSGKLTWKNILKGAAGGAIAGGGVGLMLAKRMGLTWSQGMLVGAAVGLGIALVVEAITSEIVSGLDIGNSILGALGGAIAGGGIGAGIALKLGTSLVSGTAIGAVIGTGITLSIMGATSIINEGLNIGNGILTNLGAAIAGAGIGFAIGGPVGAAIGLTIGAIAGISLTVMSVKINEHEQLAQMIRDSFYDGVGIPLENIAIEFSETAQNVVNAYQPVIDMGEKLQNNREYLEGVYSDFQVLTATLGTTGTVTQEEVNNILASFSELYAGIQSNMSQSSEIIQTALVDSLVNATPVIAEQITTLIGEYQRYVEETQGRAGELKTLIEQGFSDLEGLSSGSEEFQEISQNISGWYEELSYLSGGVSDASIAWAQTVDDFNNNKIDFGENFEQSQEGIQQITQAGSDALTAIGDAKNTVLGELDYWIQYASNYGTEQDVQLLYDIKAQLEQNYADQEAEIRGELETIFGKIADQIGEAAMDIPVQALARYNDFNWFEKIWNGDENDYISQATGAFKREISDPILSSIQTAAEELGLSSQNIGIETINGIISGVQNQQMVIDLPNDFLTYGQNSAAGFANGMSSQESLDFIANATKSMTDMVKITSESEMGIHSPSKVMETYGLNIDQGLANGIKDNASLATDAMKNMLNSMQSLVDDFVDDCVSAIRSMIRQMSKAMNDISESQSRVSSIQGSSKVRISGYASGGFPEPGQLFYANEFGNPELVGTMGGRTAVANGDQIVSGIQNGVENGNMPVVAALYQLIAIAERIAEKDTTVELDGEEISNVAARRTTTGYNLGLST